MGRSLGLAAYGALARRQLFSDTPRPAPRPDGEIVWAHATSQTRFSALCDIARRLRLVRPDLVFLITVHPDQFKVAPAPQDGCDRVEVLTSDHPAQAQSFLSFWKPDAVLWTGGDLLPNLISATHDNGTPLVLLDVSETDPPSCGTRWFPDLTRAVLACFDVVMVNDAGSARMVERMGMDADAIRVSARLRDSATPPAVRDADLSAVTKDLSARRVWLASDVQASEFDTILSAHRTAARLLHSLLLVICPARPEETPALLERISRGGFRFVEWTPGDRIEDNAQVLISPEKADLGLWYRAAPMTLMGSSLAPGHGGRNPLQAAAVGSALLYGPNVSAHRETYDRLTEAGAARAVRDSDTLASAVLDLSAPDKAAAFALAAWQVVTEGAELTDSTVDLVHDMLDRRRISHARS